MSEKRGKLLVAGVGNRYRCDDAVGLHLAEGLRSGNDLAVEFWEDVDGAAVAHRLVDLAAPGLIIDCAECGLPGGGWRLFGGDEVCGAATRNVVSTHGIGLAEGIQLAGALGAREPLWVFGVQPFSVELGEELSPAMLAALPELYEALAGVIERLTRVGATV